MFSKWYFCSYTFIDSNGVSFSGKAKVLGKNAETALDNLRERLAEMNLDLVLAEATRESWFARHSEIACI